VDDVGMIDAVFIGIGPGLELLVAETFLGVCAQRLQLGHPVDDIDGETEAISLVEDG
jgi:hypothetical protein